MEIGIAYFQINNLKAIKNQEIMQFQRCFEWFQTKASSIECEYFKLLVNLCSKLDFFEIFLT